jgi:hypothetical protein
MIVLLESLKEFYSLFQINKLEELDSVLYNVSPSICEYTLENLIQNSQSVYLNKSNIQYSINIFDNYILHRDYDGNLYLESIKNNSQLYEVQSLFC